MPITLPKTAVAEIRKGLAKCNSCREVFTALSEAGLDVSDELERTDRTQRLAEKLLELQQEQGKQ